MRSVNVLTVGAILVAFCLGILLQRFYPVGKIMTDLGLRHLLPIAPNVPDSSVPLAPREWDVPAEERGRLQLFVLIGQSNMSGRGDLESSDRPQPHPAIYMFNKDYRWYPASEPLGTMPREVDWIATDGGTGVGPGLAFALTLVEDNPTLRVGLIPCARGSSSIEDWQPNTGQNTLYGACMKRIRAASPYGEVAGVLVFQGESDALDPQLRPQQKLSADGWGDKFAHLVHSLRADLGQPALPVVFAQLGRFAATPVEMANWDIIRQQQEQVRLANTIMIRTDDLTLQPDAHFTTAGYVEIGQRFASAYRRLADGQP